MIVINPDPAHYDAQLREKQARFAELMGEFNAPEPETFSSPPLHYRQRAEFKIWHEGTRSHYAVFSGGRGSAPEFVDTFPVASRPINNCMPQLMAEIEANALLRQRLFQVEFLSTLSGDLLVTLVYHKALNEEWLALARRLEQQLQCAIIGRSRKQKMVVSRDYVEEAFQVGGRRFCYRQLEGCFSQPNGHIAETMLNWASSVVSGSRGSLLELYCGNGNFTLPLSLHFDRVLATEISKPLTRAAELNCEANGIHNIAFARMSAEEVSEAITGLRPFRRLAHIELADYDFSTVFVDPPRAGLDAQTLGMVQNFANILYVSCNPQTLADNLKTLTRTHRVERLALFDQFPYTDHMECGVFLSKL